MKDWARVWHVFNHNNTARRLCDCWDAKAATEKAWLPFRS